MKTKRSLALILSLIMLVTVFTGCAPKSTVETTAAAQTTTEAPKVTFPVKDLTGYIMWGAGGTTDSVSRALTPLVEKNLGKSIVLQNKTGATGAIATQFVFSQASDGYTILFGAENPLIYKMLGIAEIDYSNFIPLNIYAMAVPVVVVPADSPFNSYKELVDYALANPGKLKMASTGVGGVVHVVTSLMQEVNNVEFTLVPFDGDGPALTALMGNHLDVSVAVNTASTELIKAGKLKALAVVNPTPIKGLDGVPAIVDEFPGFTKFLPWGPFFGAFVKNDTPKEVVDALIESFDKGTKDPAFVAFLDNLGAIPMGLNGEEADKFLTNWQSVTAWLLYETGASKINPADLGIKKVE